MCHFLFAIGNNSKEGKKKTLKQFLRFLLMSTFKSSRTKTHKTTTKKMNSLVKQNIINSSLF